MKNSVVGVLMGSLLLTGNLGAQHGGSGSGSGRPIGVAAPRGGQSGAGQFHSGGPSYGWRADPHWSDRGGHSWGANGFGWWNAQDSPRRDPIGDLPAWNDTGYFGPISQSPPTVAVATPVRGVPDPPPTPARSQTHEYTWPASSNSTPSTFALVLKDGTVKTAVAYYVQESTLVLTTFDGASDHVELEAIDREATRQLNTASRPN